MNQYENDKCPKCNKNSVKWLGGSPAHPDNRYCAGIDCDWKGWVKEKSTNISVNKNNMSKDATFKEDIEAVFRLIDEHNWPKNKGNISIQYLPQGETNEVVYRISWNTETEKCSPEIETVNFNEGLKRLTKLFSDKGWDIEFLDSEDTLARKFINNHLGINLSDLCRTILSDDK